MRDVDLEFAAQDVLRQDNPVEEIDLFVLAQNLTQTRWVTRQTEVRAIALLHMLSGRS